VRWCTDDRPPPAARPGGAQGFRRHLALAIILICYLVLGLTYAISTPLFESPDEVYHFRLIAHLAQGNGLPVQRPGEVGPWRQEGGQPPLYYLLAARLVAGTSQSFGGPLGIDLSDREATAQANPHADIGVPTADGNINYAVHRPGEWCRLEGTALAVRLVRGLSLLLGLVTLLAAYGLAREIEPTRRWLAPAATALTAFNAMFLQISATANNDALAIALGSLGAWLLVRYARRDPEPAEWVLPSLLLGAASLSKLSLLALAPLFGLAIIVGAVRRRSWAHLMRGLLALAVPAVLVGGWWYLRNWCLYGDATGLAPFVEIIGARYPRPTLTQLAGEWPGFVQSFWGLFGWMNLPAPTAYYRVWNAIGLLALAGVPLYLWRERRAGQRGQLALAAAWPALLFLALVRWTSTTPASQGRLLFPGLTCLGLWLALGLSGWLPGRWRPLLPAAAIAAMLALAAVVPLAVIAPAYAVPAAPTAAETASLVPAEVTFGGGIRLAGYALEKDVAVPGEPLTLTLCWEALAPMETDYSLFVHLVGEGDLIVAQRDRYPGRGNAPTSSWQLGQRILEQVVLQVPETARTPQEAWLWVGFYDQASGKRLPVTGVAAAGEAGVAAGDHAVLGQVALPARDVDGVPNPLHADLDGQVALVGYALDRVTAAPGESLELTLYWQALADVEANYSVFTQIIGADGRIWAQMDGWPQQGDAPTATWVNGQQVIDPYQLTIHEDTPPGVYDLQVGMYDAEGHRLTLLGETGYARDTRIVLGQVRIVAAPQQGEE
jgi:4-amino-4-deoxy-L-arabinose transferase-like glycosyltransferase